jgi:hypothetical protein
MTLTVRSATVSGATTKGSALTHAELDENFNHLSQSSNHTFTPSGTGAVATTVAEELATWIKPEQFGAVGDGTTDDTTAMQAFLDRLKAISGATGVLEANKNYKCASQLSLTGAKGIHILGLSASTQTTGGAVITYSGTSTPFLNFSGCASVTLEGVNVRYTSGSFTGTLVAFPTSAGVYVRGSSFMGNGSSTGLYLLSLDSATDIHISDTALDFCQYGILGQATTGSSFSNVVKLSGVRFGSGMTVADIRNPGQGWDIGGCDFETLAGLTGKAIKMDSGVAAAGVDIHGCWMGDATDNGAWSWVEWRGTGLIMTGNYINGAGGSSTAVSVGATSSGISITGNRFSSHSVGVDLSTVSSNVLVYGNDFTSTTTHVSGTPAGFALLQNNTLALDLWSSGARQMSVNATTGDVSLNGAISGGQGTFANSLRVSGGILKVVNAANFTASDATPTVQGGNLFKTANALATTITAFDDGANGQEITVIINDANTTIDFTGTTLKGNAGVDWTPTTGDHMVCMFDGTNWYCNVSDNTA